MIEIKRIQIAWVPRMYEFNAWSEVTGYVTVVHDGVEHYLRFAASDIDEDKKAKDVTVEIDPPTPNKNQSFVPLHDLEPEGEEDGYAVAHFDGYQWIPVVGPRILQDDWDTLNRTVQYHVYEVVADARIAARNAWDAAWKKEADVEEVLFADPDPTAFLDKYIRENA
jgi:hypothetical protein